MVWQILNFSGKDSAEFTINFPTGRQLCMDDQIDSKTLNILTPTEVVYLYFRYRQHLNEQPRGRSEVKEVNPYDKIGELIGSRFEQLQGRMLYDYLSGDGHPVYDENHNLTAFYASDMINYKGQLMDVHASDAYLYRLKHLRVEDFSTVKSTLSYFPDEGGAFIDEEDGKRLWDWTSEEDRRYIKEGRMKFMETRPWGRTLLPLYGRKDNSDISLDSQSSSEESSCQENQPKNQEKQEDKEEQSRQKDRSTAETAG